MIANARRANYIRWLLGLAPVQRLMKNRIARTVKGPSASQREKLVTHVWGEARNAAGATKTARIKVANGYALTITGSLAVVDFLSQNRPAGGSYTPSKLSGADLVQRLPGAGDRKSVVEGTGVSVGVVPGGRGLDKTKKK